MTEDALISGGKMDLSFLADIAPIGEQCDLPALKKTYKFYDSDEHLQLILSDRTVNCFLKALEKENYFQYVLSTENFIKDFGTHYK